MGIYPQPLEEIIRRAADGDAAPPAMKSIVIDNSSGGKSVLSFLRSKSQETYFVRENVSKSIATTMAIPYRDPESTPLKLAVKYTVSVASGQSKLAAHFIHVSGKTAHDFIRQKMQSTVIAWVNSRREESDNPLEFLLRDGKYAVEAILKQMLVEHGFDAKIMLQVDEPRVFEKEVSISDLEVTTKELPGYKFRTSFHITLTQLGDSVPSDKTDWEDLLSDKLRHIFPQEISVDTYFSRPGDVTPAVHIALDQELCRHNVKLLYKPVIKLTSLGYLISDLEEYDIPWKRAEMPTISFPFRATHQIYDLNKFHQATPTNPTALIEKSLEYSVTECLFKKERYDLRPDNIQRLAQQEVAAYANTLLSRHGIKIELLVSQLELDEWKFLKEFPITIETGRYDTNAIGQQVSFDIAIRACFKTLERVQHLIFTESRDPRLGGGRLEASMRNHATVTAQEFIRDISASEFYKEFEKYEFNEENNKLESVSALKTELESRISSALANEFGLTDPLPRVTVRLDQEQYGDYVQSVQTRRDDYEFRLRVRPPERGDGVTNSRIFDVVIGIQGVDFRRLPEMTRDQFNRERFEKDVKRKLERSLEALKLEDLERVGVASLKSEHELVIRDSLTEYCKREYAVNVVVKDLNSRGSLRTKERERRQFKYFDLENVEFDKEIEDSVWESNAIRTHRRKKIEKLMQLDVDSTGDTKKGGFKSLSPKKELGQLLYGNASSDKSELENKGDQDAGSGEQLSTKKDLEE